MYSCQQKNIVLCIEVLSHSSSSSSDIANRRKREMMVDSSDDSLDIEK
jgi:hypothetical protein